jgi:hypothetical protein
MAINTCEGYHYTCGEEENWLVGHELSHALTQSRNNKNSFMLGDTEILVSKVNRTFSISSANGWVLEDGFVMYNSDGGLFQCGTVNGTDSGSVSENCTYITTQTHFLDTRYNNGIFTEVKDVLEFNNAGEVCGFKETWGIVWYRKFKITAPTIQRTTKYFVVINGVKTVLKEKTESVAAYASPLIIVFPNPPSLAIPWINCDDINEYGFYDYRAV